MSILAGWATDSPLLRVGTPRPVCALALIAGFAVACGGNDLLDPDNPSMAQIYAGRDFSCALSRDASVRCWGRNNRGQLGDGTTADHLGPQLILDDLAFQSIDVDGFSRHVCGVTTDGEAYCWGENNFGQLGNGNLEISSVPVPVQGRQTFKSVSAGWRMSCGVTRTGTAYCWGRGVWGQLGDGLATQSLVPVKVAGNHVFEVVEVGSNNLVCGVTTAGQILCWGLNWTGALGTASDETCGSGELVLPCARTPMPILSDESFKAVGVGQSYACGVATSGALWCWGQNSQGQLGTTTNEICRSPTSGNPTACSRTPLRISEVPALSMVSAGVSHTCAVSEDGEGFCWGKNLFGQLGRGGVAVDPQPSSSVLTVTNFESISAGMDHTCGVSADGDLYCWGANNVGQLGTGTLDIGLIPLLVNHRPEALDGS